MRTWGYAIVALLGLAGCSSGDSDTAAPETTSTSVPEEETTSLPAPEEETTTSVPAPVAPTAIEVFDSLVAGGLVLDIGPTDISDEETSTAVAATATADLRVDVYDSPDAATEERLRLIDSVPDGGAFLQCGAVLVAVNAGIGPDATAAAGEVADVIRGPLAEGYGPC